MLSQPFIFISFKCFFFTVTFYWQPSMDLKKFMKVTFVEEIDIPCYPLSFICHWSIGRSQFHQSLCCWYDYKSKHIMHIQRVHSNINSKGLTMKSYLHLYDYQHANYCHLVLFFDPFDVCLLCVSTNKTEGYLQLI